jgi:hypothetical protein
LSGKPIECREMLKHEPGMVEDDSYMAIPRLVETEPFPGCFPKNTPTSGWSHKTSKNPKWPGIPSPSATPFANLVSNHDAEEQAVDAVGQ